MEKSSALSWATIWPDSRGMLLWGLLLRWMLVWGLLLSFGMGNSGGGEVVIDN